MNNLKPRFKTTSKVSKRSRLVEYDAGQYIFKAGDLGTEMYVIHEGSVEVVAPEQFGDEDEAVAILEKGDFFGELGVLDGLPRTASIRALTAVKLVRIDGTTFTQLLRAEPEIAVRIMRKLSRRLRLAESADQIRSSEQPEVPGQAAALAGSGVSEAATARLVHRKTSTVFPVPDVEQVLIGRRDPITGIEPHVDVTSVDSERSCSRQHAKLLRHEARFMIVEDIGTTNGTFLNEERLETGVSREIQTGDELRFGKVVLAFESE